MKKGNINIQSLCLALLSSFILSCTHQTQYTSRDKKINFDLAKTVKTYDMKNITENDFQIIPLETTDSCLISTIVKIELRNRTIYIQDKLAQAIYIYDLEGKYKGKINEIGKGPGEYINLSYMTVTDTSIIVIDHFVGKQIEYHLPSLQFVKEERIFDKIWCTEIFTLPGYLYYINDWSDAGSGKFRLFIKQDEEEEVTKCLPYKEAPVSLGINGPVYAICENKASVIYSGDDMIYCVEDGKVYPEYQVVFKDKKVAYDSEKVESVFRDNSENGRIIGINSINESEKYLFIDVNVTGENNYTCLYNKLDSTTIIYPQLAINSLFDNEQVVVQRIIDNQIISWRDANILLVQQKYLYAEQKFENKEYESRLKSVLANLKEDDNPVLFIYNLK